MSRVAKSYIWWPEILEGIRTMTRFWRNQSWREWIARALRDRYPDIDRLVAHFTATTAKWRFATIVLALSQLLPLRRICENELRPELFTNAQEKAFINDVLKCCRDARFWTFVALVGPLVMDHLEHCRRWGLICGCVECNKRRKDGAPHVKCVRNGRRLAEAWPWLQTMIRQFQNWSHTLTPEACEGSDDWCKIVRDLCARSASEIRISCRYLGKVPWLLATASSVDGAKECVKQIEKVALELHDPRTRDFVGRVGNELKLRAAGGELGSALKAEVDFMAWASEDETCGEGFHRETTLEKVRAPGSTTIHMKQKTRAKGVVRTIRKYIRKGGEKAKRVVCFEWSRYKRILQTSWRFRWRPKHMTHKAVLKRVYREDAMALENWASVMQRVALDRPAAVVDVSNKEKLEREYLSEVLRTGGRYEVHHDVAEPGEDGAMQARTAQDYFEIINVAAGQSKVKQVHTFDTADETQHTEGYAVEVQFMSRWKADEDVEDDGCLRLFPETDPQWIVPTTMIAIDDWRNRCWEYKGVKVDDHCSACVQWFEPERAIPRFFFD